jgi:hypothetical protein
VISTGNSHPFIPLIPIPAQRVPKNAMKITPEAVPRTAVLGIVVGAIYYNLLFYFNLICPIFIIYKPIV